MTSARVLRGHAFVEKARRLLAWSRTELDLLKAHGSKGEISDVERCFWNLLAQVSSLHESLEAAAETLDNVPYREALQADRLADPLLHYLWRARNSETHDSVLKWKPSMHNLSFHVVDEGRFKKEILQFRANPSRGEVAMRLIAYLYNVQDIKAIKGEEAKGLRIDMARAEQAGVHINEFRHSLALRDFGCRVNGKVKQVKAPEKHFETSLPPEPAEAIRLALEYYEAKINEITD